MQGRKIWSLAWVLAVLIAGLYGLGKLSLLLYGGSAKQLPQGMAAEVNGEVQNRRHFYRRAITIETIPPQPVLKNAVIARGLTLPQILKKITVSRQAETGGKHLRANGLHLVVQNASDYEVEQTQLQVEYLSKGGVLLSSDIIPVNKLRPHSRLMVRVPAAVKADHIRLSVLNIYIPLRTPPEKYL